MNKIPYLILSLVILIGVAAVFYLPKKTTTKDAATNYNYTNEDIFTYDILYSDSPKNEETPKGETTYQDFLNTFNSFPWAEQIRLSNQTEIQSPTLSVHDEKNHQTLFVSMSGDPDNAKIGTGYVIGITKYTGENSNDSVVFALTADKTKVLTLIEKFFGRSGELEDYLKSVK